MMVSSDISSLFWTIFICTSFALFYSITTTNFIYSYINTITATNSLHFYAFTNTIITPPRPRPPPPPSPPSLLPSPPTPSPPPPPSPPPVLMLSSPPPSQPPTPPPSLLSPQPLLPSPPPSEPPPPPSLSSQSPTRPPLPSQSWPPQGPPLSLPLPPPPPPAPPLPPPPPSKEEDDDLDLFRLAAKVNPTPTPNVPQKLAFMFLTTSPLPLAPLWEIYFHQNQTQLHPNKNLFNIYIHADPSFPYNPPFSGLFFNRTIPSSKPTQRGSPSLISAARRLLSHALLHDSSNARFILISTTCIPIHSFNFTYNTLIFQTNKSFIELLKNEPKIFNRYVSRGGVDQMLPEIPFEEFRVGSQFFILNRRHARVVVKDERVWNKFKLPCLRPKFCYPEEHYFSTLLNMEDSTSSTSCVPATLTHVDWSQRLGSHPRMYKEFEIGFELIDSIRRRKIRYGNGGADHHENGTDHDQLVDDHNYPFLFARKFSPKCLKPLMDIADDVLFKN